LLFKQEILVSSQKRMPITNMDRLPTARECLERRRIKEIRTPTEAVVFFICLVLIAAFGFLSFAKVYSLSDTQNSTQSKLTLINDTLSRILMQQQFDVMHGMAKWSISEREANNTLRLLI